MNKKGFLLAEETLKAILAVIAIGFLAYLLFALYKSGTESKNLELAKESADFLKQEINAQKTSVDIYNPKGWWIISWPREGINAKACSNLGWEYCVCIFDKGLFTFKPEDYAEDSNEGACIEMPKKTIVSSIDGQQSPIKIKPPLSLSIKYGNEILITQK